MRRVSLKSKKGKSSANDENKESVQELETQGNGDAAASDGEEPANEKKTPQNNKGKRGRKSAGQKNSVKESDSDDDSGPLVVKSKKGKKGRKSNDRENEEKPKKAEAEEEEEEEEDEDDKEKEGDEDAEYEVEKVVDCRLHRGVKQFRIRWKGYKEDTDTWEFEGDVNCPKLIEEYLAEHPDAFKTESKAGKKPGKRPKNKPSNSVEPRTKKLKVEPVSEEDGEKIYEVERVLEVHFKKNGQREFLIRWKGFTNEDDTWEPEANLNCPDLIEKFMLKVNKAKELTARELRANPQITKRFTLNTPDSGRRLSSRNMKKQRATYYNAE